MTYSGGKPQEFKRKSFGALKTSLEPYIEEYSSDIQCIQVCEPNSEGKE